MARVVGIDLGTTNSLVAVMEEGVPRCLPNPETGEVLLPSAVTYLPNGEVVVGGRAKAMAAELPFDTILSVKPFIGLDPEHVTDEDRSAVPVLRPAGQCVVSGVVPSSPAAAARARGVGRRAARAQALGRGRARRASSAPSTVPAYFNDSSARRRAPRQARGLECCGS
jgi:molecular chaperone DnaK